jgi:hypothetical protein
MFGCSRKAPFIHQRLYDSYLPGCIQDSFAVSAAYCTKTSATEDMVFRTFESKVGLLVQQDYKEANLQELLAALQALILFHIIQLFDGDIRQRSLAEQNMDTLRAWTVQLKVRATELPPPFTWQEWIFEESVRRTVIFSLMLDGLFSTLKKGYCSNVKGLNILPFASNISLWEAGTAASWLAESRCLASDNVLYGDFVMSWERGRVPEPLDDFQKLLLTPCLGETYREVLELEWILLSLAYLGQVRTPYVWNVNRELPRAFGELI